MSLADTYSQPDAADPVLSDDRVLELARRHIASAAPVTAVDETGGEARAYMCGDDVVVKTQRPHRLRPRTSLEKEAFILDAVAEAMVPIPRLFGYGREADVEYLVMSRIPGVTVERASLADPERVRVLEEIGATVRRLHDVDQSAMRASALIPGDRSGADLRDRMSQVFEHLVAALERDPRWAGEIDLREVSARCLAALPTGTPPVTLHSNPGPEHCFVDPESGRLSGLIDFGDAFCSHPALDLRSWTSLDDSRHILAGYKALRPLPEGFGDVWRAGMIVTELRLGGRGRRDPADAAAAIRQLLEGGAFA